MKSKFIQFLFLFIFSELVNFESSAQMVFNASLSSENGPVFTPLPTDETDIEPAAKTADFSFSNTLGSIAKAFPALSIEQCSPIQFKYALMLDREVETLGNVHLYEVIDEWYGTRYLYGGTGKKGIDCSALTGKLYAGAFGITLPRTARLQHDASVKISLEDLQEGDLVFFNTRGGVSHVGLYLGNDYFVHSSVQQGVTISKLSSNYYRQRFLIGGRISSVGQ